MMSKQQIEDRITNLVRRIEKRNEKIEKTQSEEIDRRHVAKARFLSDIDKIKFKAERAKNRSLARIETLTKQAHTLQEKLDKTQQEIVKVQENGIAEISDFAKRIENTHSMVAKIQARIEINEARIVRLNEVNLTDANDLNRLRVAEVEEIVEEANSAVELAE